MKLIAFILATTCRNSDAQSTVPQSNVRGPPQAMPPGAGMGSGQTAMPPGSPGAFSPGQSGMPQGGMPQGGMQPHPQPGMMGAPETNLSPCQFVEPVQSHVQACQTATGLKLSPLQQNIDNKMLMTICNKCNQLVTSISSNAFKDCAISNGMSLKKSLNTQVCASVSGGGATGEAGGTGPGSTSMSEELTGPSSGTSGTSGTSTDSTDDNPSMSESPSTATSTAFNSTVKPQRNSAQICVGSVTFITTAMVALTAAFL